MKTTTKFFAALCIASFTFATGFAQVKVGDNPGTINESAALEIESTNKGFLPPRVSLTSLTDGTTIANPATGLVVYNTNVNLSNGAGIYVNSGTPAAPDWGKIETTTEVSGGSISKLIYTGTTTNAIKTLKAGKLEWRFVFAGGVQASIEARLTSAPTAPVTITGQQNIWSGSADAYRYINQTWSGSDWSQWKQVSTVQSQTSQLAFINITGESTFYRVSSTITFNSYQAMLVEIF